MIPPVETLKKDTLGETYEHINRLIEKENFDANEYIEYNANLNVFEKKVQAIFIDRFKIKEGVINCLLSNDPDLVRRILKCDWFFEDAVSPEFYERNIFPNVSLSTRCKIINKLARNIKSEDHAEQLFKFTNTNYGSQYAEMFLAKCSFQFISAYITECKPSFQHHNSGKNLINICKRFPDIAVSLLENELKSYGSERLVKHFSKLVKYLAKNHPLVFWPVFEKFHSELSHCRFGKKSTKVHFAELMKIAKTTPELLLEKRINISVMFKCLTPEEQMTCLKLLVQGNKNCYGSREERSWSLALPQMRNLLKLKPPKERAYLVEKVFFQVFSQKFLDHPELWSLRFLEVFPADYRANLVQMLQEKSGDKTINEMLHSECRDKDRHTNDVLIYLLSCKNAFPMLTKMMPRMTTIERREILLQEMIRNCIINEDPEGLESVVKYICIRHKNEDPRVINSLISGHLLSAPKLINLNAWDLLEQMAALLLVTLKEYNVHRRVLEGYIVCKLQNNLDVRSDVKNLVKLNFIPSPDAFAPVNEMNKCYSKTLIMLYYNEIFSGDSDYAAREIREKLSLGLLASVNKYNRIVRRVRMKVEDLPLLVESIDAMMKSKENWENNFFLRSELLTNAFFKNRYANLLLDLAVSPETLQYLMKSHPDCVINSLEKIIDHVLRQHDSEEFKKFFTSKCVIDFLDWMPKLEKLISEKFKTSVFTLAKVNALKSYSHIASLESFTELIKEYIPNEERFHFDRSKGEFHEIQMTVPQIIRNVKPVSRNFDLVLKYLKKDFWRWILPSFVSVCHNSSVGAIMPVLKEHFLQKEVSVRKVILRCILDISSKAEKLKYCRFVWENEGHSSVKEIVFRAVSGSLEENSSNEVFEIVRKCIVEADEVIIHGRLNMKRIPAEFLDEYASALWEFTERYEGQRFAVICRGGIISHFESKDIRFLSQEFCEKILRLYLFEHSDLISMENFCCHYVMHHSHPMDRKLSLIVDIMRERQTRYSSISCFINELMPMATRDPKPVLSVFEAMLQEWPKMYGVRKMFLAYLKLNYMKGYGTAREKADPRDALFAAEFGKELRKIVNAIPGSDFYVEIFNDTLCDFFYTFNLQDRLEPIIKNFLGSSFGRVEGVIAIKLLPWEVFESFKIKPEDPGYNSPGHVQTREEYETVFTALVQKNDDVLQTCLNLRMDNALD